MTILKPITKRIWLNLFIDQVVISEYSRAYNSTYLAKIKILICIIVRIWPNIS